MLHVLMVASEMEPYAKTGGLADVCGALPAALSELGVRVTCVLPRYGSIDVAAHGFRRLDQRLDVRLGDVTHHAGVWSADRSDGVTVLLLDAPALYDRRGLYQVGGVDHGDNDLRFAMLSRGALAAARRLRLHPDVVHAHDWQAALTAWVLRHEFGGFIPSVLTVHNLGYQGRFPRGSLHALGIPEHHFTTDGVEFHGMVNLLKAGLVSADRITTVSETYAREILGREQGFGLDGVLRARAGVLSGIVNGADYGVWSPDRDPLIPRRYSASRLAGKADCRAALCAELGLDPGGPPIAGVVSRLATQKGIDLVAGEAPGWLARGLVQLAVLGTGEPHIEEAMRHLGSSWPGRASVSLRYDDALAHRIEAGADLFLMPSRYEPCGLSQLYSLRYGTVPIVRAVGGLDDTVRDVREDPAAGTGYKVREHTGHALTAAMEHAVATWRDSATWRRLVRRGMEEDFSWTRSARRYADLYEQVIADS